MTPGAWVGEIALLRSVDRHTNEALLKEAEKRLSWRNMQTSQCIVSFLPLVDM